MWINKTHYDSVFGLHIGIFFSKDRGLFSKGDYGNKNKIHLQDYKINLFREHGTKCITKYPQVVWPNERYPTFRKGNGSGQAK